MNRPLGKSPAWILAFLLALSGPLAAAQGNLPQDPVPGDPPAFPQEPGPTPSQTADRVVRDTHGRGREVYQGPVTDVYRVLVDPVRGVDGAVVPGPLVVLRDGAGGVPDGPDAAFGIGGPPRTFGEAEWGQTKKAAQTGEFGYAIKTGKDGGYPLGSSGMLLSSEIDLNTRGEAYRLPMLADSPIPSGVIPPNSWLPPSSVEGPVGANWKSYVGQPAGSIYSAIFVDLEPRLTFTARFNLGKAATVGRDGATLMVFPDEAPKEALASPSECAAPKCYLVEPATPIVPSPGLPYGPAYTSSVTAFSGGSGFSGSSNGWVSYSLNLLPWRGHSVWVGFYFASMSAGSGYFGGGSFSQSDGFYGFHLDNLVATAPWAIDNVQVRALREPSQMPHGALVPTLRHGQEVLVATEVRNTGTTPARVRVAVELKDGPGAVLGRVELPGPDGAFNLPPGAVLPVQHKFPPLPNNQSANAVVSVQRLDGGDPAANPAGAGVALAAQRAGDSYPQDDVSPPHPFQVADVRALVAGEMQRSHARVPSGESVRLTLPLENLGNVPESFTLRADVYDVTDPDKPVLVTDLLPPDQLEQDFTLDVKEFVQASWDVAGTRPGQYRLFVHDTRDDPFDASDLLPDLLAPIRVPYVEPGTMTMNGLFAEPAWGAGKAWQGVLPVRKPTTIPFGASTGEPDSVATLRLFHDADNLYVGVTAPSGTTNLRALFDQDFDQVATDGGEDGVLIGPPHLDLHYNATQLRYVADLSQQTTQGRNGANFEFFRPLDAPAGSQDLEGNPERLGLFLEMTLGTLGARGVHVFHFPVGAEYTDGGVQQQGLSTQGLAARDGSISNEMAAWMPLHLLPSSDATGPSRLPLRALSPGFGVARGTPPLFLEGLEDCTPVRGWFQGHVAAVEPNTDNARYSRADRLTDKWNCGPLGPGGANIFFEGLAQDPTTTCRGKPCPPYAVYSAQYAQRSSGLTTPPIEIGAAKDPWLVLVHQQAHQLSICDGIYYPTNNPVGSGYSYCKPNELGTLLQLSSARVEMETWDPVTRTWGMAVRLRPEAGYSTETSAGVARAGGERVWFDYDESACRMGTQLVPRDACGWWDPTGWIPAFQPRNETLAVGGGFRGSPWRTDRFHLTGFHGINGNSLLDVQGTTVRFTFTYIRSPDGSIHEDTPGYPNDLGMRIGAVALLEDPGFLRDVGVTDVKVATTLFDPAVAGIAPDENLTLLVTVRNEGLEEARGIVVQATGRDIQEPDGSAMECPEAELPGVLPPGASQNVTIPCHVADRPGALLRIGARVQAGSGDELPSNNFRERQDAYLVRRSPALGMRVGATPEVGPAGTVRNLFLSLENRGNVPLAAINVSREIQMRVGLGDGEVLGEFTKHWRVDGVLPVGGSLRIQDPALQANPPVLPSLDLVFTPSNPGTFDIVARASLGPGLPPATGQTTVRAQQEIYGETFDAPPVLFPGLVEGSWSAPQGNWSIATEGDRHGKHLAAGDPATAEVPANADAMLLLPNLDLTSMRSASLSLNHRYDLERGFDAGRIEASTNGGLTWEPLTPKPQPLAGLPDGYPSLPVFGPSPLLGEAATATAVAFTGRSGDLPGAAPDGYAPVEVNLAGHPDLRRQTAIDRFQFQEFAATPRATPRLFAGRELQFHDPSWNLRETDAEANGRFWWIENATLAPQPASGSTMWWSGTAGENSLQHPSTPVCAGLSFPLDLENIQRRPGDRLVLSWWDWRSGWEDDPVGRSGTGGIYTMEMQQPDRDGDKLSDGLEIRLGINPDDPDSDHDLWNDAPEYFLKVDGFHGDPARADIVPTKTGSYMIDSGWKNFHYDPGAVKDETDGDGLQIVGEHDRGTDPLNPDTDYDTITDLEESTFSHPRGLVDPRSRVDVKVAQTRSDGWTRREVELNPYTHQVVHVWFNYLSRAIASTQDAVTQTNLGWFIDDLQVSSWLTEGDNRFGEQVLMAPQDFEGLEPDPATGKAGNFTPDVRQLAGCSPTTWTLVGAGAAQRPGGWHVEHGIQVPGVGATSAWRFAADNDQGYPNLANARLVTPVIDLAQVEGREATLRFNHKYAFESSLRGGSTDPAGFTAAIDGGAVEFQVLDAATGAFGPWRQLFKDADAAPDRLAFDMERMGRRLAASGISQDQAMPGQAPNREKLARTGYTAIAERGPQTIERDIPGRSLYTEFIQIPGANGFSFERFGAIGGSSLTGWKPHAISYLFSGLSPGVDGWREEAFDLSHLIGQRIRLAFHAQSNPGYADASGGPLFGWAISDVAVEGEVFEGKPVQVRLRLATDGSITRGAWDVDDVRFVGVPFQRNLAIRQDRAGLLTQPSQTVDLYANVTNLGATPRQGLAIAVRVTDADKKGFTDFEVVAPDGPAPVPAGSIAPTYRAVYQNATVLGPYALTPVGVPGDSLPLHLRLKLPAQQSDLEVTVDLLEDTALGGTPSYRPPDNEVSGSSRAQWRVTGELRRDLRPVPPMPDRSGLVAVVAGTAPPGQPVPYSFLVALRNNGTTAPETDVRWRLELIERKGPGENQQAIRPEAIDWSEEQTYAVEAVPPGKTTLVPHATTLPGNGLYRVKATIEADGAVIASVQQEFFMGPGGDYYSVDFAQTDPATAGWSDQSGGATPPESIWRAVDGRLLWGVTPLQREGGQTYCTTPNAVCSRAAPRGTITPTPTQMGFEGIAVGPIVDLTRVPQGKAFLTLTHGHGFEPDDGGRLEARPLRTPANPAAPSPAFTCGSAATEAWFALEPDSPEGHRGQAVSRAGGPVTVRNMQYTFPHLVNPLTPNPPSMASVVGGPPVGRESVRFDLSRPARSPCPDEVPDVALSNYQVQFRLRVGTRPGLTSPNLDIRSGALGWQVDALEISSTDFDVAPARMSIPMLDGAPKRFALELSNNGPVADTFRLRVDMDASTIPDASWVALPEEVRLEPGQRASVPFNVSIPADTSLSRQTYTATLLASSSRSPLVERRAQLDLRLDPNALPDLALRISLEKEEPLPAFGAGTIALVHTAIFNVGQVASRPSTLLLKAAGPDGQERVVGSAQIAALCPVAACGKSDSSMTATFEWKVPEEIGTYSLVAEADPALRLLESSRSNNVGMVSVRAVPVDVPDPRVDLLEVTGVGPDGYVEEGAFTQIFANVTNAGSAPAHDVEIRLLAGSSELSRELVAVLNPGEIRTVSAFKSLAAGETLFTAIVLMASGGEADAENNVLSRLVSVRGHDLGIRVEPGPVEFEPGGVASRLATVHNRGNAIERVLVGIEGPHASGWLLGAQPNPVTVPPNGNASVLLVLQAPMDAQNGTVPLLLTVRPVAKPSFQANTTLPATIHLRWGAPRLHVGNLTAPPGPFLVPFELHSRSNAPQPLNVTLDGPSAWPGTPAKVVLAANGRLNGTLSGTIPPGTAPGLHEILLSVRDRSGLVGQGRGLVAVTEKAAVQAQWTRAAQGEEALGSRQVEFDLRVSNTGNVPVAVQALPRDLAEGLRVAPQAAAGPLLPGANATLTLSVTMRPDTPPGPIGRLDVWITPASPGAASERVATLEIPAVDASPNLVLEGIEVLPRGAITVGQPLRILARVSNHGTLPSPSTNLSGYVNGILLEDVTVAPLDPGSTREVEMAWHAAVAGHQLVTLIADGLHAVLEANEDDNGASVTVVVERGGLQDQALRAPGAGPGLLGVLAVAALAARRRARRDA